MELHNTQHKLFEFSTPTEMRNGRESLAGIIREKMQHDSYSYDEAPEDNAFQ